LFELYLKRIFKTIFEKVYYMKEIEINIKSYQTKLTLFFIAFLLVIILSSCSSMVKVNSQWKDSKNEIVIDGKADDWEQSLIYFEKENLLIGARNDNQNLYMCFKSNDRDVARKMFMSGFTIWLNNEADKSKSLGIHYPIGMMGRGKMPFSNEQGSEKTKEFSKMDKNNDRFESMLQDMELLKGEDKENIPVPIIEVSKKYGINAKILNDDDIFTYEIAIPLSSDIVGLKLNNNKDMKIGIGFETGEFKKPDFGGMSSKRGSMPPMGEGGNSPGGMPPMGGGNFGSGGSGGRSGGMHHGGGQNGGRSSSERQSMNEPIQLWVELKLAEK
jgi:hypothetical protein